MKRNVFHVLWTRTVRNKEEILPVTSFDLDSIDLVPPPKSNVLPGKLVKAELPNAKVATRGSSKIKLARQHAGHVLLDRATKAQVTQVATLFHQDRT